MNSENTISEQVFVLLIDGLKAQLKYEHNLNKAFKQISSENMIIELAPNLSTAISDIWDLYFTSTGVDIIFDYVYSNLKICEFSIKDKDNYNNSVKKHYSFKIKNSHDLYKILIEFFVEGSN